MARRRIVEDEGARGRVILVIACCALVFAGLSARLVALASAEGAGRSAFYATPQDEVSAARPDIVDRHGEVLATDLVTASLYGEPRAVIDVDEAVEGLTEVLPTLNEAALQRALSTDKGFVWLQREITAREREAIHDLGLPGIGFYSETKRFYPGGSSIGHVLGHVDIDNRGIAGMERAIDADGLSALQSVGLARKGKAMAPVALSVDLRVQHAVRNELSRALERYRALAAIGIVLDARTFEVVAMVSLPDYDPNQPAGSLDPARMNRATTGVFELGSIFKTFTLASALDAGAVRLSDQIDARSTLFIGRHRIRDFHAKSRWLTVPEVFKYSSNIGTSRIAFAMGAENQRAYLKALGFFDRVSTELPESAAPLVPSRWPQVTAATVAFGHGLAVTPMHAAVAAAATLNGGTIAPPTFHPRTVEDTAAVSQRVFSPAVSQTMRDLMALNAAEGSGRRARVPGYRVGGKTGTAEKAVRGRYADDKRINSFLAAFPIDDPAYIVLAVLDEPKPEPGETQATAGMNAAPTVAGIVSRIAPMLGVVPRLAEDEPVARILQVAAQE